MDPLRFMLAFWGELYLAAVRIALAGGMPRDTLCIDIVATIREAGRVVGGTHRSNQQGGDHAP